MSNTRISSIGPHGSRPFSPEKVRRAADRGMRISGTKKAEGFTLLEVMVSMAIIAVALSAVLGSQSQSVSIAAEAKFNTTASSLLQSKIAEIESADPYELSSGSGDFGEDFPGYTWEMDVRGAMFMNPENVSNHLKRIDVTVRWGDAEQYVRSLSLYRFCPEKG